MLLAGLRAAVAAAEDSGATRADLRAIRTLLTTIFRKYKTEMQVGWGPIPKKTFVTKIVTRLNFDSMTCVNY